MSPPLISVFISQQWNYCILRNKDSVTHQLHDKFGENFGLMDLMVKIITKTYQIKPPQIQMKLDYEEPLLLRNLYLSSCENYEDD